MSLNGDFADIVIYPPSSYGGIISLQVKSHPEVIPALLTRLVSQHQELVRIDHFVVHSTSKNLGYRKMLQKKCRTG